MISTKSTEHKKITASVTWFLATDMALLYQVDKRGLRELVQALLFTLMGDQTAISSQDVQQIYRASHRQACVKNGASRSRRES